MEQFIIKLFRTLESYGLKVNPEKSSLIVRVQGSRLRKFARSRTVNIKQQPHWARKGFSRHHRVRVWQTCVVSSAMYGLLTKHFNGHMVAKLRAWFHRQLRAVVNMPAHLTKVSNNERKIQHLQADDGDPATKGPGIISFWQDLHRNLQQADTQTASAKIVETQSQGQRACPTCGLYYPTKRGTQAASSTPTWANSGGPCQY